MPGSRVHKAQALVSATNVITHPLATLPGGPEWVVVDRTDPTVHAPCPAADMRRRLDGDRDQGYTVVADRDGVILLEHPVGRHVV